MQLKIEWQQPTIALERRTIVEVLLATELQKADFLADERGSIVVHFVPNIPVDSTLVATIVAARLGKLLGVLEAPTDGKSVDIVSLKPMQPVI